jgi:hypothetical protein
MRRGDAFVTDFLDAYGRFDLEQLEDFIAAHELYTEIWQAHAAR